MPESAENPPRPIVNRARTADAAFIRQQFDELKIEAYLEARKLRSVVRISRPPRVDHNQPPGTMSQLVDVLDASGTRVAEFHQYLLPDGSIGASGRRDPKGVLVGGVYYRTL